MNKIKVIILNNYMYLNVMILILLKHVQKTQQKSIKIENIKKYIKLMLIC